MEYPTLSRTRVKETPAEIDKRFAEAERLARKLRKYMEENEYAREYYSSFTNS